MLFGFAECDFHLELLLPAENGYMDSVSGAMLVHHLGEVLLVFDFFAIDGDDEIAAHHDRHVAEIGALVAAVQAGTVGGASGDHLDDQQAVIGGQAHLIGEIGVDGNGAHAQRRTPHAAQRDEVIQHSLGGVDGNGKADAGALPDVRSDQGVDADDLAVPVEQRAAGVARD